MVNTARTYPSEVRYHSNPERASFRLLVLPDWQGGKTAYVERMASSYGSALNAETWIFHPYHTDKHLSRWEPQGQIAVEYLLADRLKTRRWLQEVILKMHQEWLNPDLPLVLLGFCFGGTLAFEAARSCSSIAAAISIHGDPSTDMNLESAYEQAAMVLLLGGADPLIPHKNVSTFTAEMQQSNREWFLHTLGQARHSFTKEEVGFIGPGSVYSEDMLAASIDLVKAIIPHTIKESRYHVKKGNVYA